MPAFAPAFDILATDRKWKKGERPAGRSETYQAWTRGSPPQYAFASGDVFHSADMASGATWAEQTRRGATIKVLAVDAEGVTVSVHDHVAGAAEKRVISCAELEGLLRDGI
jgi:hypothetical protein